MLDKKEQARLRKQKSRARQKQLGIKKIEVTFSPSEREKLEHLCQVRGGVRGPYSVDEYISTLIRRDHERLEAQLKTLDKCERCKAQLPGGCEGLFKGASDCFHTQDCKILSL